MFNLLCPFYVDVLPPGRFSSQSYSVVYLALVICSVYGPFFFLSRFVNDLLYRTVSSFLAVFIALRFFVPRLSLILLGFF